RHGARTQTQTNPESREDPHSEGWTSRVGLRLRRSGIRDQGSGIRGEAHAPYPRIARSWMNFNACHPAEIAPSCQSGSECGVTAADPTTMRLSTLESLARRSALRPAAYPPSLYFTLRHHTA